MSDSARIYGSGDTLTHMKTTVELNKDLLHRAKQVAAEEGTTLRALLESGLRSELDKRKAGDFALTDASVDGKGTQPGVAEGDWDAIRDAIYLGRGA